MANMGLDFGLGTDCFKHKFRWLFKIPDICASGVNSLPPAKGARPNISFKEMEVQHINETLYYPSKPEWKPITLVLFDLKRNRHPVFDWFKNIYNPCNGEWKASGENNFKKTVTLELYDGCGNVIEEWRYDNAWPQAIEFGELDMGISEYLTIDITLRYDRAVIEQLC